MRTEFSQKVTINAAASKVWRVIAHEFDRVAEWSSPKTSEPWWPFGALGVGWARGRTPAWACARWVRRAFWWVVVEGFGV